MHPRPSGIVTLTTDFGGQDPYVGILEGALLRGSPKVQTVHMSHGVAPQHVAGGAFVLWAAIGRFPDGSVHVGVVDPGVGTERRLLAVSAHGCYWLAPDNGALGAVLSSGAHEVRAIDCEHLRLRAESATFHGRDLLAPVAAWLASGRYSFTALGPRVSDHDARDLVFDGATRLVHVDHYGNLISNVRATALGGCTGVRVGGRHVPLVRTYGDVAGGDLLAYVGSFGLLEVARRDGSAAAELGLQVGAPIEPIGS